LALQLEGKRALITGARSGIGRAVADAYVAAGARVAVGDIEGAPELARELGDDVLGVRCDVRSTPDVQELIEKATAHLGGLDVLVNNAGVEILTPLHEASEEEFDHVIGVNLRGVWLVYKHAVPALVDGGGAIVNIASVAGLVGSPCSARTAPPRGAASA
jgi:NAD(P)-dependent dehydrogenase (short-subunit alcohol dehydrogenase family)